MQAAMTNEGLYVAAFAFILDADGTPYVYDINTNTNYNSDAEVHAGCRLWVFLLTALVPSWQPQRDVA